MSFLEKLTEDIKTSMKNRDADRLGTLRLIKSEIKNKEIEVQHEITEAEFMTVLSRMVKQRKESIEQFVKGGRDEMAAKEENEITVISDYLPQPLSDSDIDGLISEAITKTGASGPQGMGLVMKELKEKTTGRYDGKQLADKVKTALASS